MTRYATCGKLPPAIERERFCPVCSALQDVPQDDDDAYDRAVNLIFDKCDRISAIHRQYARKRR